MILKFYQFYRNQPYFNNILNSIQIIKKFTTEKSSHQNKIHNIELRKNELQNQNNIIDDDKIEEHELMTHHYEQISVPAQQNRNLTHLSNLQRTILKEGNFDLKSAQIDPKMSGINSYAGVQSDGLTEIDLGAIGIKSSNEVLLSEVDPYNIPADYDIRFDQPKKLLLVGHHQLTSSSNNTTKMQIKTQQSIQQKTVQELVEQQFGLGWNHQLSKNKILRNLCLAIPLIIVLIHPLIETVFEVKISHQSISAIEKQQMKQISIHKSKSIQKVILNDNNFVFNR